ncbi:outer membrane protein [Palleronia abyssalis]|uniref:Outer membrane protein beta-barrel domain-containing protein n=1 Tax=Palleronia abyssalis TaxID=1501240 RepID=A0A2R8C0E6_9RHOB|nr:outer membrane beta-barrel protein [Palleronia abyssalis]SPJ25901.1 hypothetical protein PAA8504_03753 [Palleronia abyssalis]
MKFITTAAVGALFAGSAYAGGVTPAPVEPMVMTPAPVVMSNDWTGGYAGLSLGYGGVNVDGDVFADLDDDDDDDDEDDLINFDIDGDGVIGGAFAGYQYDFGNFVLGGELDLNAANLDFDDDDFFGDDLNVDFDDDGDTDDGGASFDQIHRLKLRAGYDAGNTLIYGVVGAAYAEAEIFDEDYSDTGYVLGAGVDYKVAPNVTVGGEVLYHEWNDFDDTGADFDATTVQARVAYQF